MRRSPRRRTASLTLVSVVLAVAFVTVYGCQAHGPAKRSWADGSVHGPWLSVYDGYGENDGHDGTLTIAPQAARLPEETHAGLIVSTAGYGDMVFSARMRAVAQLRTPKPNPWEVPWLVWAYTDPEHFYYVTLKPNGWELGKRDPAYPGGQRFLATGPARFPVGRWYHVLVTQRGTVFSVQVGGRELASYADTERPYDRGSVGVYTEDARGEFRDLTVRNLPPGGVS
jgi:hypothetical protein